jgi:hypothetical protein
MRETISAQPGHGSRNRGLFTAARVTATSTSFPGMSLSESHNDCQVSVHALSSRVRSALDWYGKFRSIYSQNVLICVGFSGSFSFNEKSSASTAALTSSFVIPAIGPNHDACRESIGPPSSCSFDVTGSFAYVTHRGYVPLTSAFVHGNESERVKGPRRICCRQLNKTETGERCHDLHADRSIVQLLVLR